MQPPMPQKRVNGGWPTEKMHGRPADKTCCPSAIWSPARSTELGNGAGTIVDNKVDDTVHKFLPGKLGDWVSDKVGNKVNNIVHEQGQ